MHKAALLEDNMNEEKRKMKLEESVKNIEKAITPSVQPTSSVTKQNNSQTNYSDILKLVQQQDKEKAKNK